jgi:hypothetical protein
MINILKRPSIIEKVEQILKTSIVDSGIPPQGMESAVVLLKDTNGLEYAIKHGEGVINDIKAFELLDEYKVSIPIPKIYGKFIYENKPAIILGKVNFPLLESVDPKDIYKYLPSMIENLKKIHTVKSNETGYITNIEKNKTWKDFILSFFTGENSRLDWGESMFGDPLFGFANVRLYMWHFKQNENVVKNFYKLLKLNEYQLRIVEIYWLSRVVEYLAYYSEELNAFNSGRIKLHQDFLKNYNWKNKILLNSYDYFN